MPAVGAGIGAELLFIEALEVVQRLLGGEAKNPVGVALQGGEVVKGRRLFGFVLALQRCDHRGLIGAGLAQGHSIRFAFHAFAASIKPRKPQRDRIERLRLESVDFRFPLYDQRQRGRHHTPNIQRAVIENGEKPRGVNAYQPVGLAAAERRRIEIVVCAAVFERFEALADRRIFHRRDPQALHGLVAFVEQIDRAEDGLALAPSIAGIDDLAHVLPVHERVEQGKLLGFVSGNGILPALRQDGQIVVAPFGVLFIVGSGFGQFGQVPKTPGHDIAAAYKIAVLALIGTKNGGDGFSNRGLFRNYQFILSRLPFLFFVHPENIEIYINGHKNPLRTFQYLRAVLAGGLIRQILAVIVGLDGHMPDGGSYHLFYRIGFLHSRVRVGTVQHFPKRGKRLIFLLSRPDQILDIRGKQQRKRFHFKAGKLVQNVVFQPVHFLFYKPANIV